MPVYSVPMLPGGLLLRVQVVAPPAGAVEKSQKS